MITGDFNSWHQNWGSTIQANIPTTKIWHNIRRFCGLNPAKHIHCITTNNNVTTNDKNQIANLFAQHWSISQKTQTSAKNSPPINTTQ